MGVFWRGETPDVVILAVKSYPRPPLPIDIDALDALQTAAAINTDTTKVLLVHSSRHVTKIAPPVVQPISIDVVNMELRKFASHIDKGEPMG